MNPAIPIPDVPSLLDIFRSRYSNNAFALIGQTFVRKPNTLDKAEHFIHDRAPALIEHFLPIWQRDGFISHTSPESLTGNMFIPLDLLSIAQGVFLRFTQTAQYLQVVKRTYLLKLERMRGKKVSAKKGVHLDKIASVSMLKEMYSDWETTNDKTRADRKARFRRENRQARRWLFLASRLSSGILIISSPELEKEVNSYRTSDSKLMALANMIRNEFPGVFEMYRQLDTIAEGLLNLESSICSDVDSNLIAAQLANFLYGNHSNQDGTVSFNTDDFAIGNPFAALARES